MVKTFADALMSAEADALCNAEYGQVSDERVNHRNGYRPHEWDTRAGTVELAVPKLRQGSYFPYWLLERRRRTEQALISVVATTYLLDVSACRVEKIPESLGVTQLSKSQVSTMARHPGRWSIRVCLGRCAHPINVHALIAVVPRCALRRGLHPGISTVVRRRRSRALAPTSIIGTPASGRRTWRHLALRSPWTKEGCWPH